MTTPAHTSLPSLDDIVFEGRNKAYGAYVLRKEYGRHVTTAVILATFLAALLIAIPLVIQQVWPKPIIAPAFDIPLTPINEFTVVTIEKPAVTPPAPAIVTVRPPSTVLPTKILPDKEVKDLPSQDTQTPTVDGPAVVGPVASTGDGDVLSVGPSGSDTVTQPAAPAVTQPFVHVEVMPEFVGGSAALSKYLQKQLRYPTQALRAGIAGKVYISFTVNADGSIADVSILKGLGYGTDEEASRVISQMPAWKPGYQNKHAVPVRYTLPITFKYE